jgi:hypothetical protein
MTISIGCYHLPVNTPCQSQRARRSRAFVRAALALLLFVVVAPALFAYVVKLKDGSLVFARAPYTVKGKRAIITLENGTVTQIDLEKIDVPGTEKYNKENFGNVIALDTPQEKVFQLPTPVPKSANPLQDLIKEKRGHLDRPTPGAAAPHPGASGTAAEVWQPDPIVQAAFAHVFEGTGQSQYRVTSNRGKTRLLATAASEQAVFETLSASARAILAAADRGRSAPVEIVLTTASGESAGTFEMTPAQAKVLVDRAVSVQDYFVRNVIF